MKLHEYFIKSKLNNNLYQIENYHKYTFIYIYTYFASPPAGSPKVEKVKKGHNAEDFSRFMIHDPGLEMGQRRSEEIMPTEHVNSEIDIKVKALSVILNHSNYEVAHAMVK